MKNSFIQVRMRESSNTHTIGKFLFVSEQMNKDGGYIGLHKISTITTTDVNYGVKYDVVQYFFQLKSFK